jgi:hypothetical protein
LLGWAFLLLAIAAVVTVSSGIDALGLELGPSRKFFRRIMVGGTVLVVVATAAALRLLGARFFRD